MSRKPRANKRILVVDDERDLAELLELTLMKMGLEVDKAHSVGEARGLIDANRYDLCLTDMRMTDGEGLEIIRHIQQKKLDLPTAVITAYGSTENAVSALKAGAFDYLAKPVSLDQLRTLVKSALRIDDSPPDTTQDVSSRTLMGDSAAIRQVLDLIDKLARSQAPVYITGESGSGKERAARAIHAKSSRAEKEFVAVNCGAIPENLMESEFFGYKKGAFTGATEDRDGFFQAAGGGTLFLDEVADLPLAMQVKLLRAIQERKVRKVGSTQEEPVDVRLISATHQNLAKCVEAGRFRQDLYYRINVIELKMPPLREMGDDFELIARHVLARLAQQNGMPEPRFDDGALQALKYYDFPGNVRELENMLERALALSDGITIHQDDLQLNPAGSEPLGSVGDGGGTLQDYLDRVEKQAILEALEKTGGNRTQAAKLLGVTFRSMRYRMERLGMKE
ncbi:two-component system, NtrC family, response regulator PilR [Andreprevotia lacus DSM 23236]|jgi:two-component system response regulator PilR (NtrC family)|uniref:Two-component system, NtrC family, response regulator PilR n=1 Tax=Andreprevotia lacus DSM 23236 TaxID=1121001 RepID=A0A1W1Y0P7_9NEIS|nr:sigma-54 dependent transcriptional regulator [Andreprevotia lacus]SMC29726.1 two-component system, NtrC family, response regulator PilR [Andreprevotia lacus DSM 23236]